MLHDKARLNVCSTLQFWLPLYILVDSSTGNLSETVQGVSSGRFGGVYVVVRSFVVVGVVAVVVCGLGCVSVSPVDNNNNNNSEFI